MVLTKASFGDNWERLIAIDRFGQLAGLFQSLNVRTLGGRSDSDPFQLEVKMGRPSRNIMDVGYGISQVLPIIVELFTRRRGKRTFLLQQPEVHLHPRAQAALGTLLCQTAASRNMTLVAETHSDQIIDRVRMEVRDKTLLPEQVSILFFERNGSQTEIYRLKLDPNGNFKSVPPGYRAFFERETDRLLGIR